MISNSYSATSIRILNSVKTVLEKINLYNNRIPNVAT